MSFEFKLSTDKIRKKMFDYIKPVYKNTWDFDVDYINWTYGVYDSESNFFITYVSGKRGDNKYILMDGNDDIFYVIADGYRHTIREIPDELVKHSDIIKDGIKVYNNEKLYKNFESSFSTEQQQNLNEIIENMKDKCRPCFNINCYEDAERLFRQEEYNYYHISHMYSKNTVENFDKYMSDEKMRSIRGEKYRTFISGFSAYNDTLSQEDYNQASKDFHEAGYLFTYDMDDMYADMTFKVIKKAYYWGVISVGYVGFIEKYIKSCIKLFPDKIHSLCPLLDFINENMRDENFKSLEFYRKELEKLIYKKTDGFQFICTTDELREKMFRFLKPEYKRRYDSDVRAINWITGVYHEERGIFLTQTYHLSDGIARCGINYHSYIVITDDGNIFTVDNNHEYEKRRYDFRIPDQYKALTDLVKEGIEFYGNAIKYRQYLDDDTIKRLKAVSEEMDDRCHRNYMINCEEDAHRLFVLADADMHTIFDIYNKKTISDFNKFATEDKISLWRGDKYLQLLNEVMSSVITNQNRRSIFNSACHIFSLGVNDTYDKQFLRAVEYMYTTKSMASHEETILKNYIEKYSELYPDKLRNVIPLIKLVEVYAESKYLIETMEKVKNSLVCI